VANKFYVEPRKKSEGAFLLSVGRFLSLCFFTYFITLGLAYLYNGAVERQLEIMQEQINVVPH
jgi:hypothetical protein